MLSYQFKLLRSLYSGILYALLPVIFLRLWLRGRQQPDYRKRWRERLGIVSAVTQPCILIHCVSVGETHAAEPLIEALLKQLPNYHLHITTMTPTGSAAVTKRWHSQVSHSYLPYDIPCCLNRFLNQINPSLTIVLETEIWPNLLFACHQQNIPLLLSNARLSQRSMKGYKKLGTVAQDIFNLPSHIAAQTHIDATHLLELGVDKTRISVTGNLKFDKIAPPALEESAKQYRHTWGLNKRPLLIAGSTREGEEKLILDAFKAIKLEKPAACLLLAPRHPQRIEPVKKLCLSNGFDVMSSYTLMHEEHSAKTPSIILIDTMGDLPLFYAMADSCFVGGSLLDHGCHNVLEPAMLGKPIITGPSTYNFKQICEWLTLAGGLIKVEDVKALTHTWLKLINEPDFAENMGKAALGVWHTHQGATKANMKLIKQLVTAQPSA